MTAYKAFRAEYMHDDQSPTSSYSTFDARLLRYAILWAMYQNDAYSRLHKWGVSYKTEHGLYEFIRGVYNPAYRLGEFWKTHLLGGRLDPAAGDGKQIQSALPIITDNERLRPYIAQLWNWSNWQINKDIFALWTTVLGDGFIKVIDDVQRQRVYMLSVNPSTIKELDLDPVGNIKGYIIEEQRYDPREIGKKERPKVVTYREVAERNGEWVIYRTFLDKDLYAWDGETAEWGVEYGFIPMVMVQHNNLGMDFGWSELLPGMTKFREVDDLASKLSDQIRKTVDSGWLFTGVPDPNAKPTNGNGNGKQLQAQRSANTDKSPQQGRQSVPVFYAPPGADAKPLVAPLNISETAKYILDILDGIERDFPELRTHARDVETTGGTLSGRALKLKRQEAETKVLQRRPNYDNGLKRAMQMSLSIGGMRGYYGGINLNSYKAGDLDFNFDDRPVFTKDVFDDLEHDGVFYDVALKAKTFGLPPLVFLRQKGWSEEQIAEIEKSPEWKARIAAMEANVQSVNQLPRKPAIATKNANNSKGAVNANA